MSGVHGKMQHMVISQYEDNLDKQKEVAVFSNYMFNIKSILVVRITALEESVLPGWVLLLKNRRCSTSAFLNGRKVFASSPTKK